MAPRTSRSRRARVVVGLALLALAVGAAVGAAVLVLGDHRPDGPNPLLLLGGAVLALCAVASLIVAAVLLMTGRDA